MLVLKKLNIFFILIIIGLFGDQTRVEAFEIGDIFKWPFSLSEKLFNWNPFKVSIPAKTRFNNWHGIDEDSPLFEWKSANLTSLNETNVKRYYTYGCECRNYTCSCCGHIEVGRINLNETGCLNISYHPTDYSMELTFQLNDWILYNNTISITNPPPLCFDISQIAESASICLKFYNLDARNKTLSGCVDVIAKLYHKEIARVKIGCFRMANHSTMIQKNIMGVNYGKNQIYYTYSSNIGHSSNQDMLKTYNLSSNSIIDVFSKLPSLNIVNKIEIPPIQTERLLNSFYENFFKLGRAFGIRERKLKSSTPVLSNTTTSFFNNSPILSSTTAISKNDTSDV